MSHREAQPNPLVNNGSERPHPEARTVLTLSLQVQWGGFEFRSTLGKEDVESVLETWDVQVDALWVCLWGGQWPCTEGAESQDLRLASDGLWVSFPLVTTLGDGGGLTGAPEETKPRLCWLDVTPDSPSPNKKQWASCQHRATTLHPLPHLFLKPSLR